MWLWWKNNRRGVKVYIWCVSNQRFFILYSKNLTLKGIGLSDVDYTCKAKYFIEFSFKQFIFNILSEFSKKKFYLIKKNLRMVVALRLINWKLKISFQYLQKFEWQIVHFSGYYPHGLRGWKVDLQLEIWNSIFKFRTWFLETHLFSPIYWRETWSFKLPLPSCVPYHLPSKFLSFIPPPKLSKLHN